MRKPRLSTQKSRHCAELSLSLRLTHSLPHHWNEENHPTNVGFPFTKIFYWLFSSCILPFFLYASPTFRFLFITRNAKTRGERKSFQHFSGCFPSRLYCLLLIIFIINACCVVEGCSRVFFLLCSSTDNNLLFGEAERDAEGWKKEGFCEGNFQRRKNMKTQFSFSRKSDGKNAPLRRRDEANGEEF